MQREQHVVQDAAEHYAVFLMQRHALKLGLAGSDTVDDLWVQFTSYLSERGYSQADFEQGDFAKYKTNADLQLPSFVERLAAHLPGSKLNFENVEKEFRDRGLKADFLVHVAGRSEPYAVSLKNYTGSGGIKRPQVASGTFASFAHSFVFDRVGVGRYTDPRPGRGTFMGSNAVDRAAVLEYLGLSRVAEQLAVLDRLQAEVREEFLAPDAEFYDKERVRAAVVRVAGEGIPAVISVLDTIGNSLVREVFLTRIGFDGKEESLFFDAERYVDSITNRRYHELRFLLNDEETEFSVSHYRQGIRFAFRRGSLDVLVTDVPFTINTNGAWHRPKVRYSGTQRYLDKGVWVDLRWGQRRPRKSKEIATSVNTYLNLSKVGIFGE